MERYPADDADLADEELFADPDEVDFPIEDEFDEGLQADFDDDED